MSENENIGIGEILNHPEVQKVTGNVNMELIERRAYKQPLCGVFSRTYTVLKDCDE